MGDGDEKEGKENIAFEGDQETEKELEPQFHEVALDLVPAPVDEKACPPVTGVSEPDGVKIQPKEAVSSKSTKNPDSGLFSTVDWSTSTCLRWPLATVVRAFAFVAFNCYLVAGVSLTFETCPSWCEGVRLLVLITFISYTAVLVSWQWPRLRQVIKWAAGALQPLTSHKHWLVVSWAAVWIMLCLFVVFFDGFSAFRLRSLCGLVVIVVIGYIFSADRSRINWRQVQSGLLLQFVMGLVVLRLEPGKELLYCFGKKVSTFLAFTQHGSRFVFGYLVDGVVKANLTEVGGRADQTLNFGGLFFFSVLPVVFFVAFIVEVLYYYGIMQRIVLVFGKFLRIAVGTSITESVSAAANIFLGMTEAPLMIKPYFPQMSRSELHAIATGGFSTVSGSTLAAYISFGISPAHLLSASFMSAPAALALAKLFYPELERRPSNNDGDSEEIKMIVSESRSMLEAASKGASDALSVVGNIAANLICFLASLALINAVISYFAAIVTLDDITLEVLFGYLFTPLAYLLGVPTKDCAAVGELLGLKTFANEFIAYKRLGEISSELSSRSVVLSTYALCGFANLGSLGIMLGACSALCPQRAADFAKVMVRALVSGTAACLTTACVAGCLIYGSEAE